MQRFLLAGLTWLLCLGSVTLYMNLRPDAGAGGAVLTAAEPHAALARFDLETTLTFRAEADPFALTTDDAPSVGTVSLNGVQVLDLADVMEPGRPHQVRMTKALEGPNELLVLATPPSDFGQTHAVRVRVFSDGVPLAEETFWSEGGSVVRGTLTFEIARRGEVDHDD